MAPFGRSDERWLAAALFTALAFVMTYPLSLHPGSVSLGSDPDVHTFAWTLGWDVHALTAQPWAIFDANIFFPYPRTLAFSENLIGNVLFAAPVVWLTGNYVLAMNVVALASVALCGLGAYVLARQLGLSVAASLACGIIFAFSPARFFRFQQIHLTAIQFLPFSLAALHAYFQSDKGRDLRLAILFFTLQALSSLHGAVFLLIAIVLLLVQQFATGTPLALSRRARDVGIVGIVLLLPLVRMAIPYLQVQQEMGLVRTLENWIPSRESFLASPTHVHLWLLDRFVDRGVNERANGFLFPGYVPIALCVTALLTFRAATHRPAALLYGAMTAAGLLLSVGPPLSVWPYVYWLPGFNFIRIPARFFLLAMLGVAVLAAIGYDRAVARLAPRYFRAAAAVACVLLIAEFIAIPLPVTPFTIQFASVDRWVATLPQSAAIAEVPVGPSARYHSTYMLHSMAHWRRTVHGHSSLLPPLHEQLYDKLRDFPDDASLRMLTEIGVTHVVVHPDLYAPGEWPSVDQALSQYASRLSPIYTDTTGRVYRLQ